MRSEDEIRDYLSEHLDVIEPGLNLYKKELYVPSEIGTRSFIDLVARDRKGALVLIELKRSAAASREAIHEVLKYVEAVKEHIAIREDEIRVIIASTDWSELLVPFSRLLADTTLAIKGISLEIQGHELKGSKVAPLQISGGRILAPWHDVNYCENRNQVAQIIKAYTTRSDVTGMKDYIILILHSASGHISQHEAVLRHFTTGISPEEQIADDPADAKPTDILRYHYIVYFAAQMLSETRYWSILNVDFSHFTRYREEVDEMDGDELLLYLHDNAWSSGGAVERSYLEIGYPAKLGGRLLSDEAWEVWGLLRYGSFERNALLSDETLIEELCGSEGYTRQGFDRDFEISNRAQVASVREGVSRCLEQNIAWKTDILRILTEVHDDYPSSEIELHISNPAAGLLTPYFFATKPQGPDYLPGYSMGVLLSGRPVRAYAGYLSTDHQPAPLQEVLQQFYEGDIRRLMISFSWGGRTPQDQELTEAYGCRYSSLRRDLRQNPLQLYRLEGGKWAECDPVNPIEMYTQHILRYPAFFQPLFDLVAERDHGSWFEA